jgi:hypothetical protein
LPHAGAGGSQDALHERDTLLRKTGGVVIPHIVDEILNEQLARKLA